MFFEIIRQNKVVARGEDILSCNAFYEINQTPSLEMEIPIKYYKYLFFKNECKVYFDDGGMFHGVLMSKDVSGNAGTIKLQYAQILEEWNFESVPTNVVKKNAEVSKLMKDVDIINIRPPWEIKVKNSYEIEYEFSREKKREVLDKIINLTPNLNYRIHRDKDRYLELGIFGTKMDFLVSTENLLDEVQLDEDGTNIANYSVMLSDKNDGGATSITLRDIFMNKHLQTTGFPVVITGNRINTQATQTGFNYTEYAPNNTVEYAILDEEGIKRENGDIYETTFSSNDIQPIQEEGKPINNVDRIRATVMLYQRGVRKLRYSRRVFKFTVKVPRLPVYINVGDKVRFVYANESVEWQECKGLLGENTLFLDDWFYIISIELNVETNGAMTYSLVLSKDLTSYYSLREV